MIWIAPDVLGWLPGSVSSGECEESTRRRAYYIWAHAEQILNEAKDDLYLADAVTTLKRAIGQRLRTLNSIYYFKNIPIKDKPSKLLEQLEYCGVIRSSMLKKLNQIRNSIEHEDLAPPKHSICEDFLEFTWFFLRSTDTLLKTCVNDYLLESPDEPYWISVSIGAINWEIEFTGWIYPPIFLKQNKDDWIQVKLKSIETRKDVFGRLNLKEDSIDKIADNRGKNPEDIYFTGLVQGPTTCLRNIIRQYFSLTY